MKKNFRLLVILFFSLFLVNVFSLTSAHAAGDIPKLRVKFGNIDGDSRNQGYRGWSRATGVSLGVYSDCLPYGQESCQAKFDELTITKYSSIDGPELARACVAGTTLEEVRIVQLIAKSDALFVSLWEIKLDMVVVSGVSSGINSADGQLMEAIGLKPETITWIFYHYDDRGHLKGTKTTTWDLNTGIVSP